MATYHKSNMLTDTPLSFCPGCTHGIAHKLIAEVLQELGQQGNVIGVAPVGCSVFAYKFFNCDMQEAAHGRAPAVATGIKRVHPDKVVFSYQGDGDLASIGLAEIMHAGLRGENITVVFINNAIYGMTGGQMAPTSLIGQKTTTSPFGRTVERQGNPIRMCEMLASQDGPAYLERVMLTDYANVLKAKRAIKKAFEYQIAGKGFSMVECLSTCPTNWHMTPVQACQHIKDNMTKIYPLGVFKDVGGAK
ncbi:MAG: thiamine pyrophosphate-dependent enzyme [Clostridia bacterium]|nr:thiamine pyrophosphate-dependent enzyme [Clostridia bacterium]MDD3832112.1 thiamine pyrophosphate-dependent enzyme [Clostridia bacterium]